MHDWDDVKFFLATARGASTLSAARTLGVNHATVARRIAALEAALAVRLFDRKQDGYRLTELGASILDQAERVALEMETLERLIEQRSRNLTGTIRVTTLESIANVVLTPLLSEFIELYPDIRVELISTDNRLDLARGDADISIRASLMPSEKGVVVRKLTDDPWALYCSRGYAAKRGAPRNIEELKNHFVIGAEGVLGRLDPYLWLAETCPRAKVRSVSTTVANALAAIRSDHGVGPLPRSAMVIAEPELVQCFDLPQFKFGFYLLTRTDMKDLPRVKAFTKFILARRAHLKQRLEGRAKPRWKA